MSDSPDYDPTLLAWVTPVVAALAHIVPAEQLMLVGAQCRDLLHWRYCQDIPPRATNDTDIAVALKNWDHFERIRATFPAVGSAGHRFLIADRAVDVIPFGDVESPTGTSRHPSGTELMNVHGFTDAYLRAELLPLPGGLTVRIPQSPNYAVLKLHAWLDRSADHNYKDGSDLALAVHWYAGHLDRALRRTTPVGPAPL
jgi:predicted nucleotidyltransferase